MVMEEEKTENGSKQSGKGEPTHPEGEETFRVGFLACWLIN